MRYLVGGLGLLVAALLAAPSARAAAVPFGTVPCTDREGVRFCEGSVGSRVRSFDGVPLDVNVALPAQGDQNLPLVLVLPAWAQPKKPFADLKPWADRGFAALSYSPRGMFASCGSTESRAADPAGCERGWTHLADVRREVRDSQHLAGLLADEGLVDPLRVGATGYSYGAVQSLMLATLRDRMVLPGGEAVAWTSPGGRPMRIAGAAPVAAWSDGAYALAPDGSYLDYGPAGGWPPGRAFGVLKQSYSQVIFDQGRAAGFYAPPGADPSADLSAWEAAFNAGEPYAGTAAEAAMRELAAHHSSHGLAMDRPPAPTLLVAGWSDDLIPVGEALRHHRRAKQLFPEATVALLALDYGHGRALNKADDYLLVRARTEGWLAHHVAGAGSAPFAGVEALPLTCPKAVPSGAPLRASDWESLHPGEVRGGAAVGRTLSSSGGNTALARAVDPVAGDGGCARLASVDDKAAATLRLAPAQGDGYTLAGSPTVVADLTFTGEHPQVAARLWDVAADGSFQRLVSRTVLRPSASGSQVFQLNPVAWHFAAGHRPKLELLGADSPFARRSNGTFSVAVGGLELRLPVTQAPAGDDGQVTPPAPPFQPGDPVLTSPGAGGGSTSQEADRLAEPRAGKVSLRLRGVRRRGRCVHVVARLSGPGVKQLRSYELRSLGRRLVRSAHWDVTRRLRPARLRRGRRVTARLRFRDGSRRSVHATFRGCGRR